MIIQKKGSEVSMVMTVVVVAIIGVFITMFFSSNLLGKASYQGETKLFTENTELPLTISGVITNFTIDADIELKNDNSLVRVILVDNQSNEYLVYEAYPLKTDSNSFSITDACEETCALPGITASSLKITLVDASIRLKSRSFKAEEKIDNNARVNLALKSDKIRGQQRIKNIETVNKKIKEKGLTWTAGETSISKMSYQEKKKLFAGENGNKEVPNFQGFEYYKGGIFVMPSSDSSNSITGNIAGNCDPEIDPDCGSDGGGSGNVTAPEVKGWDWRVAHGENWMTPVKMQGACGSCWDFGAVGTVEGTINAYYNQHINADLSEQDVICRATGDCSGGWAADALDMIKSKGVVDEQCLPYATANTPCTLCSNSASRSWKITSYIGLSSYTTTAVKKALKEKGPLSISIPAWSHSLMLVGYVEGGVGGTIWIIRNSWDKDWGEDGYARMIMSTSDMERIRYVEKPFFAANANQYTKKCVDKDGDTYCNWGIGAKPSTCSASCKATMDCDDSNISIGACATDANGVVAVPLKYPWNYSCYGSIANAWPGCGTKGGAEICDNMDDDGDGLIDEGCDDDKDTFWDSTMLCKGYYLAGNGVAYYCRTKWTDLDDANPRIGSEKCNNKDDDVDEIIDDGCDDDLDTYWDGEMTCEGSYRSGLSVVVPCSEAKKDYDDTNPNIKYINPCTDTESGKNYALKGTTTNANGMSYTDSCGLRINLCGDPMFPDPACVKSALVEYYCGGTAALPIKVNDIFVLGNSDCIYYSYNPTTKLANVFCGMSAADYKVATDGSFTVAYGKSYKFYVISPGTINSNIRSVDSVLTFENLRCSTGTCSNGACITVTSCGDGIIQIPNYAGLNELCDGTNLNGRTCTNLGFTGGSLSCSGCILDVSNCIATPPAIQPKIYYRFDESSGMTAIDSAGFAQGSIQGNPARVIGKTGLGLQLSGSTSGPYQYVQVLSRDPYGITNAMTVDIWVKTGDSSNREIITKALDASPWTGFTLRYLNGKVQFRVYDTAGKSGIVESTFNLADNNWHRLTATYAGGATVDGINLKLYIDNSLVSTAPSSTGDISNSISAQIGYDTIGWDGTWFNGTIDEVKLYNIALTAEQINS